MKFKFLKIVRMKQTYSTVDGKDIETMVDVAQWDSPQVPEDIDSGDLLTYKLEYQAYMSAWKEWRDTHHKIRSIAATIDPKQEGGRVISYPSYSLNVPVWLVESKYTYIIDNAMNIFNRINATEAPEEVESTSNYEKNINSTYIRSLEEFRRIKENEINKNGK